MRKVSFLVLFNILTMSCTYDTEVVTDNKSKTYPNGKTLRVEKTTKETTSRGIITHRKYGISHSFEYKLEILDDDIVWDGGSAEPKNILFCSEQTYIRCLKKKLITVEQVDSTMNSTRYEHSHEIHENFQKHVDQRYFFKLLGDDYWIDITQEEYLDAKGRCDEYDIPNDAELSLPKIDELILP